MSEGSAPPGAYFVGRPASQETETAAAVAPAAQEPAVDNSSTPGDYFVGRPAGQQQGAAPAAPAPKKSGFLASWCPCLAGGEAAN